MSRKAGLLLLSEDDYETYVHQKDEAMRLQTSSQVEAMKAESRESGQEGHEDLVGRETEEKWEGLLRKLGLEEVRSPAQRSVLAPAAVAKPRFLDGKDLQKSIERLTSKPAFSSIPSPRSLGSPKATPVRPIPETAPASCASPPLASLEELLTQSFERPEKPRFSDWRLMPTKQTLAKYLSEVKLADNVLNSSTGISQKSTSLASPRSAKTTAPSTKRRVTATKRTSKPKLTHLTTTVTASMSQSPKGLEQSERTGAKPLTEEQKRTKVMEEVRTMAAEKEQAGGLGELMRMGFRVQPDKALTKLTSTELAAMKHLNARAYAMLSNNPSLLYRIISDPEYAVRPM